MEITNGWIVKKIINWKKLIHYSYLGRIESIYKIRCLNSIYIYKELVIISIKFIIEFWRLI